MSQAGEHGELIAAAAKAALGPLGCQRVGRSRSWISDQRFWAISIEFQPSGWSKGTYLNAGASWLWYAREGLAFNVGYRVADFVPFETDEQFAPLVTGLAKRAAEEVLKLRQKFKSLSDIHQYLVTHITDDRWSVYHAAVAAGLFGDAVGSQQLFHRIDAWPVSSNWQTKLKSDGAALAALVRDQPRFLSAVLAIIAECRALNRLPPDPHCLDFLNAKGGLS